MPNNETATELPAEFNGHQWALEEARQINMGKFKFYSGSLQAGRGLVCATREGWALLKVGRGLIFGAAHLGAVVNQLPAIGSLITWSAKNKTLDVIAVGDGRAPVARKSAIYRDEAFEERVSYAADAISRGSQDSRAFDTCFEMYDSNCVAAALMRRARANPEGLLARKMARDFLSSEHWLESEKMLAVVPRSKFPEAAAAERQHKLDTWILDFEATQKLAPQPSEKSSKRDRSRPPSPEQGSLSL